MMSGAGETEVKHAANTSVPLKSVCLTAGPQMAALHRTSRGHAIVTECQRL
jgi:hypothetical protein